MRVHLCRARCHDDGRRARWQARLRARRPHRHPVRQPRRIHRRLFRHHARGLGRGAGELPVSEEDHPFHHRGCRREARVLRPAAPRELPEDLPRVTFGEEGSEGFDRSSIRVRFETVVPDPVEPAMFLYTSGSTGTPKGVVLSHQSHIWVVETRLSPDLERHRYLIAAPLYHMNALALAKLACAAHATIVLLPLRCEGLHRGDRAVSADLAHGGAADDRHDAARDPDAGADRSVERRVHPHGLGAGQREPDGSDPSRAAASGQGDQRLRHDRGRPGGVRPASQGIAAAGQSRSATRIRRCSFAWSTATTGTPSRACWR